MQYVADLHLHSKYSRAVSQEMVLPTMAKYAQQKGLDILTASDWTHPLWFKEIQNQLEEKNEGMYTLKSQVTSPKSQVDAEKETLFILSTEISSIFTQNGKLRRIHNLVFAPNLKVAEKISKALTQRGCNLHADGRPIIGLSSYALLDLILSIDEQAFIIPCHVWTPHFGLYGSASGFDSIEESFEDLSDFIFGIETGLSSDPEMNWQIPELKNRSILSFSDAHSPAKMGREATVFELEEPSFKSLKKAIMGKSLGGQGKEARIEVGLRQTSPPHETGIVTDKRLTSNRIVYTVEFYPEEGKYHFSGHRNCNISFGPEEIKERGTVCPVCHKRLTEGVLNRLLQLSDPSLDHVAEVKTNQYGLKWFTDVTKHHPPYVKLVPLLEIIAEAMESTVASQKVKTTFHTLTQSVGSELDILLKTPIDKIAKAADPKIAQGISKVRNGDIVIHPGYDGEYGKVKIWQEGEDKAKDTDDASQMSLDI